MDDRVKRQINDIAEQSERYAKFPTLFSTEDGKEVFQQIMELGEVHLPYINNGQETNVNTLIAKESIRSFCLNLLTLADKDPQKIIQDAVDRVNRIKGHKQ